MDGVDSEGGDLRPASRWFGHPCWQRCLALTLRGGALFVSPLCRVLCRVFHAPPAGGRAKLCISVDQDVAVRRDSVLQYRALAAEGRSCGSAPTRRHRTPEETGELQSQTSEGLTGPFAGPCIVADGTQEPYGNQAAGTLEPYMLFCVVA